MDAEETIQAEAEPRSHTTTSPPPSLQGSALRALGLVALLYVFLVGISLMGESFKVMGGGTVGQFFALVEHPIAGLMIGMIATALIQSSSTTTSIIVGLVAGGAIDVSAAIPMVMGANIGTSVTNTLVSIGHAGHRKEFKRAFAAATVHDMFNILAVIVLLPIEVAFGIIEKASHWLTGILLGGPGAKFDSPLSWILKPVVKLFVSVDKKAITSAAESGQAVEGSVLKGGFLALFGFSDGVTGLIAFVLAAAMTVLALIGIVKLMKQLMEAKASQFLKKALEANVYAAMVIGAIVTVMVQSSSITTSTMVPLVGVGLISLEAVFPLTLGANIGTTITALIASMASSGEGAANGLQIALCHLLFNMMGILLWFPVPFMRRVPLAMASWLGDVVSKRRWMAFVYIAIVFFALPLLILGIDSLI